MTPFPGMLDGEDEDEYFRRVTAMGAPEAQPAPVAPVTGRAGLTAGEGYSDVQMPGSAPDMSAFQALAQSRGTGLPPPPVARGPNTIEMALAFLADMAMNKGRGLGQIAGRVAEGSGAIDNENYERQMRHAKEKASLEWMARRGTMQGLDPKLYELRKGQLDLDRERELRLARGHAPGEGGMTAYQQGSLAERKAAREFREKEITAYQKAMLEAGANQRAAVGEARADAASAKADTVNATQARQYAQDTEQVRQIARNIQELDAISAKTPGDMPGVGQLDAMKFNNDWPLVGAGDDGTAFRKLMMDSADLILRSRSGAAAPVAEKKELQKYQAGDFSDDESAIRVGIDMMRRHMTDELRSFAAGREEPAREVLRGAGISHLLPPAPAQAPNPASQGWKPQGMDYLPNKRLPVTSGPVPKVNEVADPSAGAEQSPTAGMVHMQRPDGRTGYMRAERAQQKLREGWKVIP